MRKSKMMSDDSQPDEKLLQALKEIDELNSSLSTEKTIHAEKVCSNFNSLLFYA